MAITSVGYGPDTVDEGQWAAMMTHVGAAAVVAGTTDLKATTVPATDRTLSVAAGVAHAHGVMATLTPAQTIQLTVAGTTRWDAVCLRRNWTTDATTLVAVEGTTTQALPAGLENTPGTLHDQPLALVQVTAGQQLPTAVVDLRTWASKVLTAGSLLVLSGAPLGTEAVIGGIRYRRELVGVTVTTVRAEPVASAAGALTGVVFTAGTASHPHGLDFEPNVFIPVPRLLTSGVLVTVAMSANPLSATHAGLRAFNMAGTPYDGTISHIDFWASA